MSDNVFSLPPPGGFIEVKGQEVQFKDSDGKVRFWFMAEDEAENIAFALQNILLDTYGEGVMYMHEQHVRYFETKPCIVCGKNSAMSGKDKCIIHFGSK